MRINHNLPALQAYTNLIKVNSNIDTSMQRLSSGHRINSVKDDPAGMAMSTKIKRQLRGLEMSDRNSVDAISAIQIAEGTLQEVHDMLHRLRELAVQAANDTYTPEDRKKMQLEMDQLLTEINDTANKTEFNGIKLLNGDISRASAIDPAISGNAKCTYISENVVIGRLTYVIEKVGLPAQVNASTFAGATGTQGSININGDVITFSGSETDEEAVAKFRDLCERNNIEIAIEGGNTWDNYINGGLQLSLYTNDIGSDTVIEIKGDQSILNIFGLTDGTVEKGRDAEISNAVINGESLSVTAKGNKVEITGSNGKKIELELQMQKTPDGNFDWYMKDGTSDASAYTASTYADILDYGNVKIQIGPDKYMEMPIQIPKVSTSTLGIDNLCVGSSHEAKRSIGLITEATSKISELRGKLGAYQNRLEYTTKGIDHMSVNMSTALSRIFDADMALEMTNLTQNNIIAQAGMSILAQANQRPQQLLQLLN